MKEEIGTFEQLHIALRELSSLLLQAGACEEGVFKSKLIVSELVSNVLQHAEQGRANVSCAVYGERANITVRCTPAYSPPAESVCADVYSESGRGLFLVKSYSETCSVLKDGAIYVEVKIK